MKVLHELSESVIEVFKISFHLQKFEWRNVLRDEMLDRGLIEKKNTTTR